MEIKIPHNEEKIKRRKTTNIYLVVIGCLMVVLGFFTHVLFAGLGIVIAMLGAIYIFTDMVDTNLPFVSLGREGIVDSSGDVSYGVISWCDVKGFRIGGRHKELILIDVKTPEKYISKLATRNRRFDTAYKIQLKNDDFGYGTPVFLDTANLRGDADSVLKQLEWYWERVRV